MDTLRRQQKEKHKLPSTLPDPPMKKAKLNSAKTKVIAQPKIQPKGHKRVS